MNLEPRRKLETTIIEYAAHLGGVVTSLAALRRCVEGEGRDRPVGSRLSAGAQVHLGQVDGCEVLARFERVSLKEAQTERGRRALAGADAIVVRIDAQPGALEQSQQLLRRLRSQLGRDLFGADPTPLLIILTHTQLPGALASSEALAALGLAGLPFVQAQPDQGAEGTLRAASRLVLRSAQALSQGEPPASTARVSRGFIHGSHPPPQFGAANDVYPAPTHQGAGPSA